MTVCIMEVLAVAGPSTGRSASFKLYVATFLEESVPGLDGSVRFGVSVKFLLGFLILRAELNPLGPDGRLG
jgi:Zn-dependent protease